MNSREELGKDRERLHDRTMEDTTTDRAESIDDPALNRILGDFRSSVHAWSEAAYNRPRIIREAVPRRAAWRKAAAWSLGSLLAAGVAGGGLLEYQHRQEMARVAAAREAQHQRQVAEQRAREAEVELARVDSDVARQVPNALEPLAQLMAEDESQ
jgi:hypothetical protein